jgi:hypothetical protein
MEHVADIISRLLDTVEGAAIIRRRGASAEVEIIRPWGERYRRDVPSFEDAPEGARVRQVRSAIARDAG